MSKRDFLTAVLIYFMSASIVVTGASLLLDNEMVFYVGELVAISMSIFIAVITFGSHTKDD